MEISSALSKISEQLCFNRKFLSESSRRTTILLSTIVASAVLPVSVSANVLINEIMYDVEGTDTDREWIEVINAGSTSVDIASFKLFEAATNHSLVSVQGTTILAPGEVAVIAVTPAKFLLDWPQFTGKLFDSSFSLSNSGETLGIKNGADAEEDTATYASSMGAQGDGKSLGRSGSVFVAQTPSPGTSSGGSSSTSSSQEDSGTSSTQSATNTTAVAQVATPVRSISIHAGGDRLTTVGADSIFSAEVYGIEGKLVPDARVVWTFGNGDTREGRSVQYFYRYPGRYRVSAIASVGEYTAEERFVAEAHPAEVLLRAETDGTLSVLNKGEKDLDISLWQVDRVGVRFRFPKNTAILAGEGVRLPLQTTGLPAEGLARLLYPNGEEASPVEAALEHFSIAEEPPASYAPLFVPPQEESDIEPVPKALESVAGAAAAVGTAPMSTEGTSESNLLLWFAGAVSLSALGAGAIAATRLSSVSESPSAVATADKEAEEYELL